jgi:hypothetical protein
MKTTLKTYTVKEITEGFIYNEFEGKGLFGLSGRLTIQPEYQRNYIYADGKKDAAVIFSLIKKYPLGLFYFNKTSDSRLEVLDGQQRITSFGRFITDKFAIDDENGMKQIFSGLAKDQQDIILNSEILVYECEGLESEIKQWFKTINTAGVPLNDQELLNAVYSGPFVTLGKQEFSNSQNANIQKWNRYISGSSIRQDFWECALSWISRDKSNIDTYMSSHRYDKDISEVKNYFNSVLDWVSTVFLDVEKEMRGLDWGGLYEKYHQTSYNPTEISKEVHKLYSDPYVKNRKGIFEYILGGMVETKLLEVRLFDDVTKRVVYEKQTKEANNLGVSNCPNCAIGHEANKGKVYSLDAMDADHVSAWSKGGTSTVENCQLLCRTHNQAKGNR